MNNAYDYYDGFQDKDFDCYEHMGSVRPPKSLNNSDSTKFIGTDSSVDHWSDVIPAVDILRNFGIDSHIVFKPSDSVGIEDNSHCKFVKDEPVDEIEFKHDSG
ncbi:MAG: hypothetical protein ACKPKO_58555, partial [Candidatus Fonsibacter sp.]